MKRSTQFMSIQIQGCVLLGNWPRFPILKDFAFDKNHIFWIQYFVYQKYKLFIMRVLSILNKNTSILGHSFQYNEHFSQTKPFLVLIVEYCISNNAFVDCEIVV